MGLQSAFEILSLAKQREVELQFLPVGESKNGFEKTPLRLRKCEC
jgi:hypothetical protein